MMLGLVESAERLAHWMVSDAVPEMDHREALLILHMASFFIAVDASDMDPLLGAAQEAEEILNFFLYPDAVS